MHSETFILSLSEQTRQVLHKGEKLQSLDINTLRWRENEGSWNILECLEHLNRYGDFYLPQLERSIRQSTRPAETEFKSGILGNYFAKSMLPAAKLNKMKTFKDKNPIHAMLDQSVIDTFIHQQIKLLELLDQAKTVSLNKVKIPTSISRLITLKLGDTFQFIIHHNIRHMQQIERIQQKQKQA